MKVNSVKKPGRRFDTPLLSTLGIQAWGDDNLYPQKLAWIVGASDSASACMDRYASFIQGGGFADGAFGKAKLNGQGDTADDLLALVADDIARYRGFALHVNYDIMGRVSEVSHVPFENCRLCGEDERGMVSHIALHPDWTGHLKRGGKTVRVEKDNIDYLPVFNPAEAQRQIVEAGGIEAYRGQVLWVSDRGRQAYPVPRYDCVVPQMSTEEGLGNISYRNVRCNFQPFGMFVTKKAQDTTDEGHDRDNASIADALENLQGDNNLGKIMSMEVEFDEEIPQFQSMQGNNYDKEYSVTNDNCEGKIYAAFGQEIFYRIRRGSLGFSTEIMAQAYEYYSTVTDRERRMAERGFAAVLAGRGIADFSIKPLRYISAYGTPDIAR